MKCANKHLRLVIEASKRLTIRLPNELLYMIFLRAITPHFFLDASMAGGQNTPFHQSVRTKKAITGVCKSWRRVGLEFLYEDIVFHHIGQIAVLIRILEANCELGKLVKSVTIYCFIPPGYDRLFKDQLRRIFDYCPLATCLNYFPLHPSSWLLLPCTNPLDETLCSLTSNITHLECGIRVPFVNLVEALQLCKSLTWLSFQAPAYGISPSDLATISTAPKLCLDRLETLRCTLTEHNPSQITIISRSWSMPSLRRLRINLHNIPEYMDHYIEFFQKYGGGLKYLHLYPYSLLKHDHVCFRIPLEYCPELEHLVLSCDTSVAPLRHLKLKWIDLWGPKHPDGHRGLRRSHFGRAAFPAFQSLRRLDSGLLTAVDWPLVFPPGQHVDGAVSEYQYPGMHIKVTATRIVRQDMVHAWEDDPSESSGDGDTEPDNDSDNDSDNWDRDESRDGSYGTPSDYDEDNRSDCSSWSSDDDTDATDEVSHNSEEGDWADIETTASIFHQTLD